MAIVCNSIIHIGRSIVLGIFIKKLFRVHLIKINKTKGHTGLYM